MNLIIISELRSCVKVEVAVELDHTSCVKVEVVVLGSSSLTVPTVSVNVKQH